MRIEFDKAAAVRRLADSALESDPANLIVYRNAIDNDFSAEGIFLRSDLGLVLEAYANQKLVTSANVPNAVWPCIDHSEFKSDIPQIAQRYELLPALHAKRISDFLCRALLDSEIFPLSREINDPYSVLPGAFGFKEALAIKEYAKGSAWLTTSIILLVIVSFIFGLAGQPILAVVFGGGALWFYSARRSKIKRISALLNDISTTLRSIHSQLTTIRDEVANGSYNKRSIIERLKAAEQAGAYVPSIIYSLLELR